MNAFDTSTVPKLAVYVYARSTLTFTIPTIRCGRDGPSFYRLVGVVWNWAQTNYEKVCYLEISIHHYSSGPHVVGRTCRNVPITNQVRAFPTKLSNSGEYDPSH